MSRFLESGLPGVRQYCAPEAFLIYVPQCNCKLATHFCVRHQPERGFPRITLCPQSEQSSRRGGRALLR